MAEHIKGRARINITDDLIRLSTVKIEKPKAGAIVWGEMEVKELFELWHSFLLLPDGYTVIGSFFDIAFYQWVIVVESDEIPLPEPGMMIPLLTGTYQRTEDGKVRLIDLNIMK